MLLLSFATYPAYPLSPFLPISAWRKGGVGIALAAMSWGIFLPQAHRLFWRREHPSGPALTEGVSAGIAWLRW